MIVLDTNVISEVTKPAPNRAVLDSLAAIDETEAFLTATVVAELASGVERLPDGRRKTERLDQLDILLSTQFEGRVLAFDQDAARVYGVVVASRQRQGRPISAGDAQIAAVCLVYSATLVTRNIRDFEGLGLELVDPWAA